ncbi:PAS domain S-box protein [Halosegnis longus]|uniref:histidine kinase n=1 Tax=Halosegnis longus TaxID=2216012 RepID=A0AAJ4R937_9EURY|nr:PAS domain S-box protein [Salella cibi]
MGVSDQPIHVLHVEDDAAFAELVSVYLERDEDAISVHTAATPEEGRELLTAREIDCIVSDYDMPEMNGIEFLERVRETYPDLPFILYTGKGSEEVASEAISAGVTDYLQKERGTSQYTVLANRIHNAVEQYRSTRALESSRQRLSLLFEESPLGIIEWSESFEIARVNDSGREILGYEEGELAGTSWETIVADAERDEVGDIVEQLQSGDGGFHSINENVRADGESIICEWHNRLVTDDDGNVVTIFSQFQDITERQTRQRELEQHRALIHAANNAIITVDESNRVQSANAAVEEMFGYEPSELIGEPVTTLMNDDTATRHEAMFTRYLQTGEQTRAWNDIEVEGQHRDGSRVPLSVTFGEVVQGGERLFVGIIRDITEESEYRQELEWTNAVLSKLLETLPIGVLAEDESREILAANDHLLELFDIPEAADDLVGDDCERVASELSEQFADPDGFLERVNEIVGEDIPVDGEEVELADGRTFVRTHEPVELPDGNGHLWTYRDATAQRRRENRLEALNRTAQELINAESREAVAEIGVTAAQEVLGLNANAIHLVNADGTALVPAAGTESVYTLIGDPPAFTEGDSITWRVYETGEAVAIDDIHDDPDIYNPDSPIRSELYLPLGEYGILIAGSPTPDTFDEADLALGRLLAGSIVTALEQIEQLERLRDREQELSEQNERLDEFASIVSHDLRNPLNVAVGRVELARETGELDHLDAVERANERMSALIDDLLTLARQGSRVSDVEAVDLRGLASGCWANVSTADATLDLQTDRSISADRSRLQQLLENLMRNALDHAGDDVTVTIGDLDVGFYVEDDGPGVPAEIRGEIFDAGYSTDPSGTGFGLSIVEQIVSGHGWDITVTDGTDGGARFEITGVDFA